MVLDSFVLGQLEIGNLLSRKFTITMSNLETHIMANNHESGKYSMNRYQVRLLLLHEEVNFIIFVQCLELQFLN